MPPLTTPLSPANTTQVVKDQSPTDRQSFWQTAVDRMLKSSVWNWPTLQENGNEVLTIIGGKTIAGGFQQTLFNIGTPANGSTVTPNPGNGIKQTLTNNVAGFTIAATAQVGDVELLIVNGASAGAIAFSGFTKQWLGDPLDTTNGHEFIVFIYGFGTAKTYIIKALQ